MLYKYPTSNGGGCYSRYCWCGRTGSSCRASSQEEHNNKERTRDYLMDCRDHYDRGKRFAGPARDLIAHCYVLVHMVAKL
jgi:hypothetical protein